MQITTTVRLFHPDREMPAKIVDFSEHGIGLVVAVVVPQGATIVVDYLGVWILADVVCCQPEDSVFRIGLRLRKALATQTATQSTRASVARLSSLRVGGVRLRAPVLTQSQGASPGFFRDSHVRNICLLAQALKRWN